jgi:hypothetical protein
LRGWWVGRRTLFGLTGVPLWWWILPPSTRVVVVVGIARVRIVRHWKVGEQAMLPKDGRGEGDLRGTMQDDVWALGTHCIADVCGM